MSFRVNSWLITLKHAFKQVYIFLRRYDRFHKAASVFLLMLHQTLYAAYEIFLSPCVFIHFNRAFLRTETRGRSGYGERADVYGRVFVGRGKKGLPRPKLGGGRGKVGAVRGICAEQFIGGGDEGFGPYA